MISGFFISIQHCELIKIQNKKQKQKTLPIKISNRSFEKFVFAIKHHYNRNSIFLFILFTFSDT